MGAIALYVETDGQSESPEQAIANAALSTNSVPFDEGDVVEVQIDATWTTPDGKHHARVSLIKRTQPVLDDKQITQAADNANRAPADNKNTPPQNFEENLDIEAAHDGLTKDDPENIDSAALDLSPQMSEDKEELEQDFVDARNPNSERNKRLKNKPEANLEDDIEEEIKKSDHNSEGLRRVDSGHKKFKPKDGL